MRWLLSLPLPLLALGFYLNFGIAYVWQSFLVVGIGTVLYVGWLIWVLLDYLVGGGSKVWKS